MTVTATRAAEIMADPTQTISPHRVIALLLDGALERIGQARQSLHSDNADEVDVLVLKTVGILNGLRASLNFDQGGEIAANLDALYDYVAASISDRRDESALAEAEQLLSQVKSGWDGIAHAV